MVPMRRRRAFCRTCRPACHPWCRTHRTIDQPWTTDCVAHKIRPAVRGGDGTVEIEGGSNLIAPRCSIEGAVWFPVTGQRIFPVWRSTKQSCHQKRSNVVNICFCVAIAAATTKHIALPKGRHCSLALCRTPWEATPHGRRGRGESYRTCGCRNAVRWRYDPPCASLAFSKGPEDISSHRACRTAHNGTANR